MKSNKEKKSQDLIEVNGIDYEFIQCLELNDLTDICQKCGLKDTDPCIYPCGTSERIDKQSGYFRLVTKKEVKDIITADGDNKEKDSYNPIIIPNEFYVATDDTINRWIVQVKSIEENGNSILFFDLDLLHNKLGEFNFIHKDKIVSLATPEQKQMLINAVENNRKLAWNENTKSFDKLEFTPGEFYYTQLSSGTHYLDKSNKNKYIIHIKGLIQKNIISYDYMLVNTPYAIRIPESLYSKGTMKIDKNWVLATPEQKQMLINKVEKETDNVWNEETKDFIKPPKEFKFIEKEFYLFTHPFTHRESIFQYKNTDKYINNYYMLDDLGNLSMGEHSFDCSSDDFEPATSKQKQLLFDKIEKVTGKVWNEEMKDFIDPIPNQSILKDKEFYYYDDPNSSYEFIIQNKHSKRTDDLSPIEYYFMLNGNKTIIMNDFCSYSNFIPATPEQIQTLFDAVKKQVGLIWNEEIHMFENISVPENIKIRQNKKGNLGLIFNNDRQILAFDNITGIHYIIPYLNSKNNNLIPCYLIECNFSSLLPGDLFFYGDIKEINNYSCYGIKIDKNNYVTTEFGNVHINDATQPAERDSDSWYKVIPKI